MTRAPSPADRTPFDAGSDGRPPPPDGLGLTGAEARALLERDGPNRLVEEKTRSGWRHVAVRSLTEPMSILLLVAAATYLALGNTVDAVAALVALVPIAGVGIVLEQRAERALEELSSLAAPTARVYRDSEWTVVHADQLVVGDAVELREGDVAPADCRLADDGALVVDESSLTGESVPVHKNTTADDQVWAGTTVQAGRAVAVVTATGSATRFGSIGTLLAETEIGRTPLERSIQHLVVRLGIGAIAMAVLVGLLEVVRGNTWGAAVIAAVSLGMTAIPEEFPLVFTIYLALGARRLTRHRALVRRLTGVETLGSTSVICTDKTGTLTVGALTVSDLFPAPGVDAHSLLEAAVLASDPTPFDPLDRAVVDHAARQGITADPTEITERYPFDPSTNTVTTVWRTGSGFRVVTKGALEGVLGSIDAGTETRDLAEEEMRRLGAAGIRAIGVAAVDLPEPPRDRAEAERVGVFQGIVGFSDPIRPEVPAAIARCHDARVRVAMVTGDHPATALAVADSLGIDGDGRVVTGDDLDSAPDPGSLIAEATVFARIRPDQKHLIVGELKRRGEVVAMTGDGINDAPALREADIGVAMGLRGTAVSREAATMVLLDDNFATIVEAISEGRGIYRNLRAAFGYLVAFHVPLIVLALAMPLLGQPLLLVPFNLIALEFLLHPIVALVFENDPSPAEVMRRPPRDREEGLLGTWLWPSVARGLLLTAATGVVYAVAPAAEARTAALACLFSGVLMLVLAERAPVGRRGRNRTLVPLLLTGAVIELLLFSIPALNGPMGVTGASLATIAGAMGAAALSTLWVLPLRALRRVETATDRPSGRSS